MNKLFSFISFYCIMLISCTQNVSTIFTIDGEFEGGETEFVVLSYEDLNEELVVDTVQLVKNKFFLTGKINGVSQVALTENTSSDLISDSKNLFFLLNQQKII